MESIEWITGINPKGEIYGTKLFLPRMIERKQGHIVNVASLSALVVLPFHIAYTTTKFGLAGFSEALWCETRRHGIGVTLVCPGSIKTNIMAGTRSYATGKGQNGWRRNGATFWRRPAWSLKPQQGASCEASRRTVSFCCWEARPISFITCGASSPTSRAAP
jgi:NAD(P)-dependent dehydrogenase (short-subunit alcohol dehydrogenase family)